jgi:catechol 2,3-dioxygenase-like lactoylglutathione lyase family enzyme
MDKKFHIAIAVKDIDAAVRDYSRRLGAAPTLIVADEYALWRTATLNFSIRKTKDAPGAVRHVGWEDPTATGFTRETDANGLLWERFTEQDQQEEITRLWPTAIAQQAS